MKKFDRIRYGISNTIFASAVVVLVIVASIGFGLYATSINHNMASETMTTTATGMIETMTSTEMMNQTYAYVFTPKTGAMLHSAWVLAVPIGMNEYAVSVHAEGLESSATYILEGSLTSGGMATVPISSQSMMMNVTSASEFQSDANGTATYWIELASNPITTFENLQLYLVPGGMMANATLVATASFTMMSESSTSHSSM